LRIPSRTITLLATAGAALALAGCATEPTSDGSASTAPTAETEVETPATGPECLVGDWRIEQDQMQAFYDAVSAGSGGASFTIEGGTGLGFDGSAYRYTPDFELVLDFAGVSGRGVITGSIAGDYTADDGTIVTSHEVSDVSLTVDVGGVVTDGSELFGEILSSAPINSAPYECTAEGPLIQFDTGYGRVPIQLTR
jgi:hypothetical protein